jgi:carbamoyltransferase
MANVLGVNAVFHDPAAALVVDGAVVAAAEEERFSRRKHGKTPVPFSTWELPEQAALWCLEAAHLTPADLDAVAYSYDPSLAPPAVGELYEHGWEALRTLFASRASQFLATSLPGLDQAKVCHVAHHVAHAASAYLAAPTPDSSVLVLDGRGERASHLAGRSRGGELEVLAIQELPHSLGLLYEAATEHLGFRRSSDEYKVMALASYGRPEAYGAFADAVRATGDGGFCTDRVDFAALAKRRHRGEPMEVEHAHMAASLQRRIEDVILDLAGWLHDQTGDAVLTMAGGVALNCVANARLAEEGPFEEIWVQPAAGDAGTALGAAMYTAHRLGDQVAPMTTAALGRGFDDADIERQLRRARVPYHRPADLAACVAGALAEDRVVGWFQGRSEWGPRALGHRSLLADPRRTANLGRLNDIKGRESFRPVAPMVLEERAAEIFDGQLPSPYMLFVHRVARQWADRVPAIVHVDGTARAQTVSRIDEPLMASVLEEFDARTGVPVLVNTSFNTAGRPMVDSPRDALECFGSSPIDVLAIGPFVVERPTG